MIWFEYKGFDSSGAKVEGQIEAKKQEVALIELKKQGLHIVKLNKLDTREGFSFISSKVSLADLEFLTAELSLLLESGVRIDKGIDIIRKAKAKPALSLVLNAISKDLKQGSSLSSACRSHPLIFDELYCNLIELGEESGSLSVIFSDLATDLKFKRDLRAKVIGSMTYPLVILSVCLLSIFFIFNVIIPKMAVMFSEAKDLPWYTQIMLSTSEWMTHYQYFLLLFLFIMTLGLTFSLKKPSVVRRFQKVALRLPLIKGAILMVERIRFNSGLAMMIKSGVAIDRAMDLSIGNIKNHIIKRELEIARAKVKRGSLLTSALKQTSLYPEFFVSLLEVGEESGNLERVFQEIANRSRQEFESWTSKMTTLLEPLMILFMGGIIGSVVVVMLLSMVSLNDIGF
ncbi:type II secretion system F family protein [Pseudoalteromonas sp. MMG012]|uniref:type II secretion system F family protein n=1 Tax=Pseudoalteromonas sp. MMG012 TaxID=2822686 RepID=UPI001B39F94C|nr:type II secretion system F family protein [Pseudoalteromonas sp. MMG012]MBQ4849243.1 type II secretion system F family protein [Pseudoalteromonas sp. MMG012]